MRRLSPRLTVLILAAAIGTSAACTLFTDRSAVQCHSDSDCINFDGRPHCDTGQSLCVTSNFAPAQCFYGTPQAPGDFLNQCSSTYLPDVTAPVDGSAGSTHEICLSFDRCRASLCDGGAPPDLVAPPVPDAGQPAAVANSPTDGGVLPQCQDETQGRAKVIYMSGSSNFLALLTKIAPIVISQTGLTPVFRTTDSCTGARSMYPCSTLGVACKNGFSANDHFIRDPAVGSNGTHAQYFDETGPHDCLLGTEREVELGESEIWAETCGLPTDPTHVSHTPGPILPILFVVPRKSHQSVISAEAARIVFGTGGHVEPWTDPNYFFIRGPGTATTRLIGRAIGVPVPPNNFWGIDQLSAQKLAANLKFITEPDVAQMAIGLLGADSYQADTFNLKPLAFQATGQTCSYVPDSDLNSLDKRNVRDGHYPIWGTVHFFAAIQNGGFEQDDAAKFIGLFQVPVQVDLLNAFIDSGWIPECAMKVQHQSDLSDPDTSNPPSYPCNCYFDSRVSKVPMPPGCKLCTTASAKTDCTDPGRSSCNYNFCEPPPPQ